MSVNEHSGSSGHVLLTLRRFWSDIARHIADLEQPLNKLVTTAEVLTITIAVGINLDRMAHFTWWALIVYGVFATATLAAPERTERVWAVAFVTATIVLAGVVVLSAARCSMLDDTLRDIGGSAYIMGNFGVHYWPWLRLYFQRPKEVAAGEFTEQAIFALTMPIVYLATTSAGSVYGCSISERAVTVASIATIVLARIAYAFAH